MPITENSKFRSFNVALILLHCNNAFVLALEGAWAQPPG